MIAMLVPHTAHARLYILVDHASDKKLPMAIPMLSGDKYAKKITHIIRNNMTLSDYFDLHPLGMHKGVAKKEGITAESIRFSYWNSVDIQVLVKGHISSKGKKITAVLRLFDPSNGQMIYGQQYVVDKNDFRHLAHRFSDKILEVLTGLSGVFTTKIAYTAIPSPRMKSIFIMDMDGHNMQSISKNKSLNLSPTWSHDGKYLAYTSYFKGFPDLYTANLRNLAIRQITKKSGANITPDWSPNGKYILFASSLHGPSNLYALPSRSRHLKRITKSSSIDISPSWSPSSNEFVFASERAGGLHLFKGNMDNTNTERLTYVGYQNDMPDWSPLGDKIVFAGRDMGTFDIFIMDTDGSNIQRLTIHSGSNEHPSFSPDGRFITFSSTRTGSPAIYIMRENGSNQTRVSQGSGILPSWSPRLSD